MNRGKVILQYLGKLFLILLATSIIQLLLCNAGNLKYVLNKELVCNRMYTLSDFAVANWTQTAVGYISEPDPILAIDGVDCQIDDIHIQTQTAPALPYVEVFYINEQMPQYGNVILHEEVTDGEVVVSINDFVQSLRLDLGDDAGTELTELTVTINPVQVVFYPYVEVAIIVIVVAMKGLFSLQKSPDYGLNNIAEKKKRVRRTAYGRVELRPLTLEDAQRLRELRNKNSSKFFDSSQITEEAQTKWYECYLAKENDYMFSVLLLPEKRWVGAVSIYQVNHTERSGEFGRLVIDRDAANERGLGLDATLAACQFAFEQLSLKTICLEVYEDNVPAVRTYQKAGFFIQKKERLGNDKLVLYMKKER